MHVGHRLYESQYPIRSSCSSSCSYIVGRFHIIYSYAYLFLFGSLFIPPSVLPFSMTNNTPKDTSHNNNNNIIHDPLRPVVFCGPSGVGKGTLIQLLMERFPNDQFGFSVSHTTRTPRPGEVDQVHYHFTTVPQIQQEIKDNKFIEYAEVHGKYYGTRYVVCVLEYSNSFGTCANHSSLRLQLPVTTDTLFLLLSLSLYIQNNHIPPSIESVESVQKSGKICILDIDVQGVQKVKASQLQPPPRYIFIAPPSREELEKRLRNRNTETEEAIQTRLANAQKELDYGHTSGNFDRVFVNADLQECFKDMVTQFQEWYPHLVAVVPEDEDKAKNDKNCTCHII